MIKMFGTTWCGDCKRAKVLLEEMCETYHWVDVDEDAAGRDYVMHVVGKVKVPLIEFVDGTFLVEPSNGELQEKLLKLRDVATR